MYFHGTMYKEAFLWVSWHISFLKSLPESTAPTSVWDLCCLGNTGKETQNFKIKFVEDGILITSVLWSPRKKWQFIVEKILCNSEVHKTIRRRNITFVPHTYNGRHIFCMSGPIVNIVIQIRPLTNNHIHCFKWDVITHPCPNFNGGLVKPPLKLGYGWVTTFHCLVWMLLLIHAI